METIKFLRKSRPKKKADRDSKILRVPGETWDDINTIAFETGLSLTEVARRLCKFAVDHVEFIESEQDENERDTYEWRV